MVKIVKDKVYLFRKQQHARQERERELNLFVLTDDAFIVTAWDVV
jgi:hypothetical protein